MKLFFTWIFSIASLGVVLGQVTFSKLPADNQLFPRNEQSEGTVAIAGTVTDASVTKISVQIFRGSNLYRYASQNLSFQNGRACFALNPTIKAETVEYQARIYIVKNRDSTLYANRVNLVAGDVYLISGQSNAVAGGEGPDYILYDPQQNEFCRTYTTSYAAEGPKWVVANGLSVNVGVWGTELQRLIRQNNQIPTCILNNGSGGQPITFFNDRNAANPSDLTTDYGRALHRSIMAGVQNQVKAIFWRQGEAEIGGLSSQMLEYPAQFDKLYRGWKQDYPGLQKVYVTQTGIQPAGVGDRPAFVRDFQRRTTQLYPDVRTITTMGLLGHDGIHYRAQDNVIFAHNLYRMVNRDFYGSTDTLQINSPDPRKIYYSNTQQTQLTIEFDIDQELVVQKSFVGTSVLNGQQYTLYLKDYIYLDGQSGSVDSLRAEGNKVHVYLNKPATATRLTYLPPVVPTGHAIAYTGPYLLNKREQYAFCFENVAIGPYQPNQTFLATNIDLYEVALRWNLLPNTLETKLERQANLGAFTALAPLPENSTIYTDKSVAPGSRYIYRLRTTLQSGIELTTLLLVMMPLPTSVEKPTSWSVHLIPNPAQEEVLVQLSKAQSVRITLLDQTGRILSEQQATQAESRLRISHLPSGLYLLRVQTNERTHTQRLVVQH
ncbi:T9SS type A sorting domain-containing protein [Siphonobacter sp.]|uniref:T9SS type A sorting domain-containing protein n=1 Tax=Siphonobacter sp. TaxID=1869184 RepID=UPI003B3BBF59